jgi:hypothetical protein
MTALIDERKANHICRTQYPHLLVDSTVDLLAVECVEAALGPTALANAAYEALQGVRMRVLPPQLKCQRSRLIANLKVAIHNN